MCTIAAVFAKTDLVIFDCDGVLVDSETIALEINREMLAEIGWSLTPDEIVQKFLGRSVRSNTATIEAHLGRPLPDRWLAEFVARIRAAHEAYLGPVDGIDEALAGIDALGLQTCIATSGSHEKTEHSLRLVGLHEHFAGRIFSASEVAHGKPAPDLFLHAAATTGVAPGACVVVEDSQYGAQAARAAGMRCIGYAGGLTPAEWLVGRDTVVVEDLRKIPELLAAAERW
jgi:HAD superfamily hydrolase (TIGR01509 family)